MTSSWLASPAGPCSWGVVFAVFAWLVCNGCVGVAGLSFCAYVDSLSNLLFTCNVSL